MGRRRFCCITAAVALVTAALPAHAQYWGGRVLEKSFEQTEFFFLPNDVLPYGLGAFSRVAPGLIDEPLLNVAVNPAYLCRAELQRPYLYLDFRNTHLVEEQQGYRWPGLYVEGPAAADFVPPYPCFFLQTRRLPEPVFSGAVLAQPFGQKLSLGLTYQALLQDQAYYSIPQDIYRARVGLDYAGNSVARTEDIPVVDCYQGSDEMHEAGHFLAALAGYKLLPRLYLGAKVNRTLFARDGSFGSRNLWEVSPRAGQSLWRNSEERTQDYDHWDMAGGFSWGVSKKVQVGATVGYLWGDAVQSLTRSDSSYWYYKSPGARDSSRYGQGAAAQQDWDHRGKTTYGGVTLWAELSPTHQLVGYYMYLSQRTDIAVSSWAHDTSFSAYFSDWDSEWYKGHGESALHDVRSGAGDAPLKLHRLAATLHWQLERQMRLHLGVQYEEKRRSIASSEGVLASRHSSFSHGGSSSSEWHYSSRVDEDKTLHWDFRVRKLAVQLPVVLTWQPRKPVELLLGLNRSMKQWEITDVTTAIFAFREVTEDSVRSRKTDFGERYTEPREKRSEVQTTFLAGVTLRPSARFGARLLAVPHYASTPAGMTLREMQWWLALTLTM
ncbi:MAG: hypothetical protein QHJ34_13565 [bacterium]|jgi:hypothetical protein|nr:hypothetical protein [candidate division KSB1 bacterium]MDH7561239.1 hypothetical protein [bacterium]